MSRVTGPPQSPLVTSGTAVATEIALQRLVTIYFVTVLLFLSG